MDRNLLVLIPSKEILKYADVSGTAHFRETGDESVYALPHLIILGETDRTGFDRRNFRMKMTFMSKMEKTDFGFVLPVLEMAELEALQMEYGLKACRTGLWFSAREGWSLDMAPSENQRLGMLKWMGDGYTLLQ